MSRLNKLLSALLIAALLASPLAALGEEAAAEYIGSEAEAIVNESEAFDLEEGDGDVGEAAEAPPEELDPFELPTEEGEIAANAASAAPGLAFSDENAVLLLGNAYPFWMLFQPADAEVSIGIADVAVYIEDEAIARLDEEGNIVALARGSTLIRATLADGSSAEGMLSVVDMGGIGVRYTGDAPRKAYDGTDAFTLNPADFQLDEDALVAGMAIEGIAAWADGVEPGIHGITVEVTIGGSDACLQMETLSLEGEILPRAISDIPGFTDPFEAGEFTYTGNPIRPVAAEVRLGDAVLAEGVDYTLEYQNNTAVGTAMARITGMGRFEGSYEHTFEIKPADISQPEIAAPLEALRGANCEWEGEAVCPAFTLSFNSAALVPDQDYTVTYENNDVPGGAMLIVEGMGNFTGRIEVPFNVVAPQLAAASAIPARLELGVGETYTLPGADSGAAFATSNKKIAAVNAMGVVKGIKKGKATIAIKSAEGEIVKIPVVVKAAPKKAALSAKNITLAVGKTYTLGAKLSPSGCRAAKTWISSDESIAKVTDGRITAVKPGKVTITMRTYNNKGAKCTVTVLPLPESVSMNRAEAIMLVKGKLTVKATVSPAGSYPNVRYYSSDAAVASVNGSGKITAKRAGTATITAETVNGIKTSCVITVYKAPSKVAISRKSATLGARMTLQLSAAANTSAAIPISWSSSNKKIATVDGSGLVTAIKAGTVKITAKSPNGKKATCKITVRGLPKSVAVKAAKTTLQIGETTKAAYALPKNTYSPIEWSVNGDAVTVDQSGNITAVKPGTATVLATATTAYVAGSVTITVLGNAGGASGSGQPASKLIIDISKWNGSIDFDKLKPNVSLVICRATCSMAQDMLFDTYARAMNARGIPFGVYCYSHAKDDATARAEARYFYSVASKYGPKFYVLDAEEASLNQAAIVGFISELRSLGARKVGCYVAHNRYVQYGYSAIRGNIDFTWIPRYGKNDGTISASIVPAYACDLWQYSSRGKVAGISGDVDVNILTGQGKSLSWFVS